MITSTTSTTASSTTVSEAPSALRSNSLLAEELATTAVLVRRDVTRFVREKSRVIGALAQPVIFWIMLGSGMAGTFRLPGAERVSYLEYFFPGVLVMTVLFSAIFSTMSVIEDRHSGFLQSVLVAPGSRVSLVLGKCLGSTVVALAQGLLFVLLAPTAGFAFGQMAWLPLLGGLALTCLGLCTLGFAVAWWLDSTAGYHVVMSVLLLPLWILSGAMFPAAPGSVMGYIIAFNPMSYAVAVARRGLYGSVALPDGSLPALHGLGLELGVLAAFAALAMLISVRVCQRLR
ncbi:MAG: ABC transporter permease [Polyangiales bacterium]